MAMVLTRLCWAGRAGLIVLGWLLSYASSVVLILFLMGCCVCRNGVVVLD